MFQSVSRTFGGICPFERNIHFQLPNKVSFCFGRELYICCSKTKFHLDLLYGQVVRDAMKDAATMVSRQWRSSAENIFRSVLCPLVSCPSSLCISLCLKIYLHSYLKATSSFSLSIFSFQASEIWDQTEMAWMTSINKQLFS